MTTSQSSLLPPLDSKSIPDLPLSLLLRDALNVGCEVAGILNRRESTTRSMVSNMTYLLWFYPLALREVSVEDAGLGGAFEAEGTVVLLLVGKTVQCLIAEWSCLVLAAQKHVTHPLDLGTFLNHCTIFKSASKMPRLTQIPRTEIVVLETQPPVT